MFLKALAFLLVAAVNAETEERDLFGQDGAEGRRLLGITLFGNRANFLNAIDQLDCKRKRERFTDTKLLNGLKIKSSYADFEISGGVLRDQVSEFSSTRYIYNKGTYAFGGNFDLLNPGGPGAGIEVSVLIDNVFVGTLGGNTLAFRGFVADEEFNVVEFISPAGTFPDVETYELDNLFLCKPNPPPPANGWLGCWLKNGPCRHTNLGDNSCSDYLPGTTTCPPHTEESPGPNVWIPGTFQPMDCNRFGTKCWGTSYGQCINVFNVCFEYDSNWESDACPPHTVPCP